MTELIKTNELRNSTSLDILRKIEAIDFSPMLSSEERQIIRAKYYPKVSEMKTLDLANEISSLLTKSWFILGQKPPELDTEVMLLQDQIMGDLRTKFPTATFQEISNAVNMGVRGEFKKRPDEVVYITIANVYNWIKSYVEIKKEAMRKQARYEQDQVKPKTKTADEIKKDELDFIKDCIIKPYNEFLKTGEFKFDNRGNVIYNRLDKLGLIPFTNKVKQETFLVAQKHLTEIALVKMNIQQAQLLREAEYPTSPEMNDVQKLIVSETKDMLLKKLLSDWKEMEHDLKTEINEKL